MWQQPMPYNNRQRNFRARSRPYLVSPAGAAGGDPAAAFGGPPQPPRRPVRTGLVIGAVALALVSGGVGGAVGSLATRDDNGHSTATNALDAPKPDVSNVTNAPAGSTQAVAQKVLPSVVMIKVASSRARVRVPVSCCPPTV